MNKGAVYLCRCEIHVLFLFNLLQQICAITSLQDRCSGDHTYVIYNTLLQFNNFIPSSSQNMSIEINIATVNRAKRTKSVFGKPFVQQWRMLRSESERLRWLHKYWALQYKMHDMTCKMLTDKTHTLDNQTSPHYSWMSSKLCSSMMKQRLDRLSKNLSPRWTNFKSKWEEEVKWW